MKISGDMAVKLALGAALVGVVGYALYRIKGGLGALGAAVPQVVKDGADATWQLGKLGAHIVTDPLDAFGVTPTDKNGQTTWEKTAPWASPVRSSYHDPVYGDALPPDSTNDPVSNNAAGVNWNLF